MLSHIFNCPLLHLGVSADIGIHVGYFLLVWCILDTTQGESITIRFVSTMYVSYLVCSYSYTYYLYGSVCFINVCGICMQVRVSIYHFN